MITTRDLDVTLRMAFFAARYERYKFISIEYLLLALLTNELVIEVLKAFTVDFDELRTNLAAHVEKMSRVYTDESEEDTEASFEFARVLQRAILRRRPNGAEELVTSVDVLIAIFAEKDSYSALCLHRQGVTKFDLMSYLLRMGQKV